MDRTTNFAHYAGQLLTRYKCHIASVVVLACLSAALNTSFGAMLKWLTDGLQNGKPDVLILFVALFALQRFLLPIVGAGGTLISNRLANRIESDIRRSWYEYVVGLDYASARLKNSGECQKRIQQAVVSVRTVVNSTFRSLLSITLEVASITLFATLFVGWDAGLLLMLFAACYSAFVIYFTRKRVPVMREIAQSDTRCAAFMHDSFINTAAISPDIRNTRINTHDVLLEELEGRKNHNASKLFLDSTASAVLCLAACLLTLTAYYKQEAGSTGTIILMATGLAQLIIQINTLGFNYRNLLSAGIDLQHISEGLMIRKHAAICPAPTVFGARRYEFSFRELRAAESLPAIRGILGMRAGVVNTLHGASGVGKSTVARVMRGEIRIPASQLFINGTDVSSIDADLLLEQIGYVSQDNIVFNESIIQNLRYGKPDVTLQELFDSLAMVGLQRLGDDLELIVGEKGNRLSGGERLRLVVARGLLQACHILILDEPFAGLDETTARDLADTIVSLANATCILVIMHQRPEAMFDYSVIGNQNVMEESDGRIHIEHRG